MVRRLISFVLLAAVAAGLLVAAFPQVVGWQRDYYVAQVIAFRGAMVAIAVVAAFVFLLVALIARPVRGFFGGLTTLLVIFALITAGIVVERGTGDAKFATKTTGDITVVSWNTRGGAPGPAAIAKLALAEHADVVSLPETTHQTALEVAVAMKAGGTDMNLFTLAYSDTDTAKSTSLLIAKSLGTYTVSLDKTTTEILPTVIAKPASGKGPTIVAVHSVAPVHYFMSQWRHDLKYLASLCGSNSDVIMAGDFNSTLDHLKGLGTGSAALGSCRDAALATSNAGVGTWPTSVPELAAAPIDHVMTSSGYKVDGFHVIGSEDKAGSDHRPVVAQLTPKDLSTVN